MTSPNSVQIVGNELLITSDPKIDRNNISIKQDKAEPDKIYGSINGKLTYSVRTKDVNRILVFMKKNDKLWEDDVDIAVTRHTLSTLKGVRPVDVDHSIQSHQVKSANEITPDDLSDDWLLQKSNTDDTPTEPVTEEIKEAREIERAELYVNNKLIATQISPPWSFPLKDVDEGLVEFKVILFFKDGGNEELFSKTIEVTKEIKKSQQLAVESRSNKTKKDNKIKVYAAAKHLITFIRDERDKEGRKSYSYAYEMTHLLDELGSGNPSVSEAFSYWAESYSDQPSLREEFDRLISKLQIDESERYELIKSYGTLDSWFVENEEPPAELLSEEDIIQDDGGRPMQTKMYMSESPWNEEDVLNVLV